MKRAPLLLCYILALHVPVFLPSMVRAEMPIEVRLISTSWDSNTDSRTSLQPQARFALNRLPGQGENHPGQVTDEVASLLLDSGAPVPVSAATISHDKNGSVTKISFNILSVAQPPEPQAQARPLLVVVAIPPDLTGELSIQYASHGGAGPDQSAAVRALTLSDVPHLNTNPVAALPTGPFVSGRH